MVTSSNTPHPKPTAYQRRRGHLSQAMRDEYQHSKRLFCRLSECEQAALLQSPTLHLDIGFGTGTYLLEKARLHPSRVYLGFELFRAGVAGVLHKAQKHNLDNVWVVEQDASDWVSRTELSASVDGIDIFHPDPWPKKRQHKRRLLTTAFLRGCLDLCKPSARICVLSDYPDYTESILVNAARLAGVEVSIEHNVPPLSKYGEKALREGRAITKIELLKCG